MNGIESLRRCKEEIDAGIRKRHDLKIPGTDQAAQPEQVGRTLCVYPLESGTKLAMRKYLDGHYDKEDLPWEPPFLECIYSDQLETVQKEREWGKAERDPAVAAAGGGHPAYDWKVAADTR